MSAMSIGLNALDDKDDNCCDLSFKQRLIGGCICMGCGVILSICSFICIATGNLSGFAIIYALGTIASIAGSFFIVGPKKHLEAFKDQETKIPHIVATACLVFFIIMIFVSVFALDNTPLAIIFVILELLALALFTITLKKVIWLAVKKFFQTCFNCGK